MDQGTVLPLLATRARCCSASCMQGRLGMGLLYSCVDVAQAHAE